MFHVMREHRPLAERIADAVARVEQIPALTAEAARRITGAPDNRLPPKSAASPPARRRQPPLSTGQASRPSPRMAGVDARAVSTRAADALATLANTLDAASLRASGSPRLGRHYAPPCRTGLATERNPDDMLAAAERDLVDLRQEAAAYGRSAWRR